MKAHLIQDWKNHPVSRVVLKALEEAKQSDIYALLNQPHDCPRTILDKLIAQINTYSFILDLETLLQDVDIEE